MTPCNFSLFIINVVLTMCVHEINVALYSAFQAMDELNGINIEGECVDISLAKPVDKKRQEKQRERKQYGGGYHK